MIRFVSLVFLAGLAPCCYGAAISVDLGTTGDTFAVLAGSTVTNTVDTALPPTTINGNLGVWPGTAVTGFPPGLVTNGVVHAGDTFAQQAQADLTTAYNFAAAETGAVTLTGDLAGMTLTPGVYKYTSAANLAVGGVLTLDALGDPNAVFVFQIGSSLTTGSGSVINIINQGTGDSVFWQVTSSATLGTNSTFAGNILALTSITAQTGATINCGRALARNGGVTLDHNIISIDTTGCEATSGASGVPEPASIALGGIGLIGLLVLARRRGLLAR